MPQDKPGTETYYDKDERKYRTRKTGYDASGVSASLAQDENRRKLQMLAAKRGRKAAVKAMTEEDLKKAGKPKE